MNPMNKEAIKNPSKYVSKEYLEREIDIAISDFYLAKNEDEQWNTRKSINKTLEVADMYYGFKFTDHLKKKLENLQNELTEKE